MEDDADSDSAPYHSSKKQNHNHINQGIAVSCQRGMAVPCCFDVSGMDFSNEKEGAR